ncbi:TIGR02587 family membrane protein [Nannocystis punicea]|uniref:TIGR02587 family membrane protein n=1 Tax=Nannocystis punicea TaxID=2995304 RepID=A0ABY7H7S9_9BACT|nr:TIGR02587 family membrane protein [Nannocystis poenicansa]WAS95325.1 TIGR02587 family membrane protein [Nannocystis poenicansa]
MSQSLREYGRGIAGGLLFSLPLLYTGEIWHAGELLPPERLLLGLAGVFVLLLGYNRYAGLRQDAGALEVVLDSVEELGLGLLLSAALLVLLGRIDAGMAGPEILGKVLVGGLAVAIGVSVGTAQLGGGDDDDGGMSGEREDLSFVGQMALSLCGAVLVAANIAPTEEIPEIAGTLDEWALLGLTGVTLAIGALVLHYSDFVNTASGDRARIAMLSGSLASYIAAVTASAALLWFFDRFTGCDLPACLAQVIVLGLPTAIGASAGRLLLQAR